MGRPRSPTYRDPPIVLVQGMDARRLEDGACLLRRVNEITESIAAAQRFRATKSCNNGNHNLEEGKRPPVEGNASPTILHSDAGPECNLTSLVSNEQNCKCEDGEIERLETAGSDGRVSDRFLACDDNAFEKPGAIGTRGYTVSTTDTRLSQRRITAPDTPGGEEVAGDFCHLDDTSKDKICSIVEVNCLQMGKDNGKILDINRGSAKLPSRPRSAPANPYGDRRTSSELAASSKRQQARPASAFGPLEVRSEIQKVCPSARLSTARPAMPRDGLPSYSANKDLIVAAEALDGGGTEGESSSMPAVEVNVCSAMATSAKRASGKSNGDCDGAARIMSPTNGGLSSGVEGYRDIVESFREPAFETDHAVATDVSPARHEPTAEVTMGENEVSRDFLRVAVQLKVIRDTCGACHDTCRILCGVCSMGICFVDVS